jgi:hypothetical protein
VLFTLYDELPKVYPNVANICKDAKFECIGILR